MSDTADFSFNMAQAVFNGNLPVYGAWYQYSTPQEKKDGYYKSYQEALDYMIETLAPFGITVKIPTSHTWHNKLVAETDDDICAKLISVYRKLFW